MTILTRYLLRAHIGPFLFAFAALTGLLLVNAVAERLEGLVGKGLPVDIILEAVVLMLPHTIALTLPMALLATVLYTFSELATHNEIVAMSGAGVQPRRLFLPVLFFGLVIGGVTFLFNDRILPEANHRLKNLRSSIQQKSPTFQLNEGVVNLINAGNGVGPYFLRVDVIDPVTSELTKVVIHDMSQQGIRRTTYAARGQMKLNANFTDLHLRLYDGYSYEVNSRKEEEFTRTNFKEQLYVMRGVGDLFEDAGTDNRSDREMSIAMLLDSRSRRLAELEGLREEALATARRAVDRALGRGAVSDSARAAPPPFAATAVPGGPVLPRDEVVRSVASTSRAEMGRYSTVYRFANQVGVEINKKIVISTSCIIFVLIGVPIGIRFPRGGVNMVIVVSSFVIGVYQIGLTNGEDWADRGLASPFWSMWAPSFLFLALGIFLLSRMGRWTAAVRGSGWREIWLGTRRLASRIPLRPGRRAPA